MRSSGEGVVLFDSLMGPKGRPTPMHGWVGHTALRYGACSDMHRTPPDRGHRAAPAVQVAGLAGALGGQLEPAVRELQDCEAAAGQALLRDRALRGGASGGSRGPAWIGWSCHVWDPLPHVFLRRALALHLGRA